MVDLPGHNDDPGDGASGYVVSIGKYLRPNQGYCLLSHSCQFEPPDTRGQGSFGLNFRDRPISRLLSKSAYIQKHPSDEQPEAFWWTEITKSNMVLTNN